MLTTRPLSYISGNISTNIKNKTKDKGIMFILIYRYAYFLTHHLSFNEVDIQRIKIINSTKIRSTPLSGWLWQWESFSHFCGDLSSGAGEHCTPISTFLTMKQNSTSPVCDKALLISAAHSVARGNRPHDITHTMHCGGSMLFVYFWAFFSGLPHFSRYCFSFQVWQPGLISKTTFQAFSPVNTFG